MERSQERVPGNSPHPHRAWGANAGVWLSAWLFLAPTLLPAQTTSSYVGPNLGSWNTAANWSANAVPTTDTAVVLTNTNALRLSNNVVGAARRITFSNASSGAQINFSGDSGGLEVLEDITMSAAAGANSITFAATNHATLRVGGGSGRILAGTGTGLSSLVFNNWSNSLHLSEATVGDVNMAQSGTATLRITNGQTYHVTNLVRLNHASTTAGTTGTLQVDGGTLHVVGTELRLNSGTNPANSSFLNIANGGMVRAKSILRYNPGTNAEIHLRDGTLATLTNADMNLSSASAAAPLGIFLSAAGTNSFLAESNRTMTVAATARLQDKTGESGTLVKKGPGTLLVLGTAGHTGLTTVEQGAIVVSNAVLSATITSNSVAVAFAASPALGTNTILAGPVASNSLATRTVSVNGGGAVGNAIVVNQPNLAVVVGAAPVITSATNATGTVGAPFSYQITADHGPTSFGASGLPPGLSVNAATGLVSGTPSAAAFAGTFTVTASNAFGTANRSVSYTMVHSPEAVTGDFSNAPDAPSPLGLLSAAGHSLLGNVGGQDAADYVTFTVPDGHRLESIRLQVYSSGDTTGTVAVDAGPTWTAGDDLAAMLGSGPLRSADVGADLLATMNIAGSYLGAGTYTLRVQRTGSAAAYGLVFKFNAANAPRGEITATPSTVFLLPGQLGSTTISWTTSGCANAQVTVFSESNPVEGNFAQSTSNTGKPAPWISTGRVFFRLYGDLARTLLLDEVVVTGTPTPLRVAGVFGNHMVLQRHAEVPVWGWADAGQTVEVTFAGQTKTAVADAQGRWQVRLDPMEASETGRTMAIANDVTSRSFTNILVGEVWVLSGQSNMAMRIDDCRDTNAVARADYPWLRTFGIGWPFGTEQQPNLAPYRSEPAADVAAGSSWSVTSPANAGSCYAVGFYFAESLRAALGPGVPIGLMQVAVGSTWGECWVGQATRDADPALQYIGTELWLTPPGFPWFADKYVMYHGLIAPLQPYGIRGVLWYQGEGNTDPSVGHYRDLLSGLIEGWRRDWGQGEFPFLIVQLPAYAGTKDPWHSYELLREAQLQVSEQIPNTGLAISIDTGGFFDTNGVADPHPPDKQPIGDRLARLARAMVHGEAIVPTGPMVAGGSADTNGVHLVFDNAGAGLQSTDGDPRTFEVAGNDGVFHPATATITGTNTVRLTALSVPRIVSVRYGWDWNPDCNLFNSEMLPASPFRAEMSGSLSASPSKITLTPGTTGSSTLTWTTSLSPGAHLTRSVTGGPEEAIGATGSAGGFTVSGLGFGKTIFRLYGDAERTRLLDSVEIIGTVSPLTVQSDGTLRLDNRPYRASGVNYFDALGRSLWNAAETSYDEGFRQLGAWGIPFARLDLTGFQPIYANLFFTDRAEYFRRLDAVVASAERHGVGLIPTFFWAYFTFSDIAGERLDQVGVPTSLTRQKMREFATEIVNRYKHSRTIWAWEFGNEWNLMVDLPNASQPEFLPPTWTDLGNPATRDPVRDILTTDILVSALQEFADLVHDLDPGRPISTGHSATRSAAWHMDQWKRGLVPLNRVWTDDSYAQAKAIAVRQHPASFDLLSIHVYGDKILRMPDFVRIAGETGQALFVGEFGDGDPAAYQALLAACDAAPLRAVWSYDSLERPDDPMVTTTTNERSWMLQALLPAGFSQWSRGWGRNDRTGPAGETAFHEYLFGAPRPGAGPDRSFGGLHGDWLSLETVVRTNDPTARVFGESTTNLLSTNWTTNGLSASPSTDQSGVLPGCQRRIFSVPADSAGKFLRLRATSP